MEPRFYAWIVPERLVVAERPGRGGRSHRRGIRDAEIAWWRAAGVRSVISGMASRHGLIEYALADLRVRWHPLRDAGDGPVLHALVEDAVDLLARDEGAVLVHCDRPGEWLAAVDAALRLGLGLAEDPAAALADAGADGLPVGSVAEALVRADRVTVP